MKLRCSLYARPAADSKPATTLALLQDWWAAYQDAEHDPAQEVVVLAARRTEVGRLNSACQELLAVRGRLGSERLQVEDRHLAVGDRVVCGKNAIAELGVANGSRGVVTAIDAQARNLRIRLDGSDGWEITLPGWYLDGRSRGERNRRVDLAYATTAHREQAEALAAHQQPVGRRPTRMLRALPAVRRTRAGRRPGQPGSGSRSCRALTLRGGPRPLVLQP
jgi:hypothetical protein